jgi:hypothetical protein
MPRGKRREPEHVRGVGPKEQRMYEHIVEEAHEKGE